MITSSSTITPFIVQTGAPPAGLHAQALIASPSPMIEAPVVREPSDETPQAAGDRALTRMYANALKNSIIDKHNLDYKKLNIENIPPDSSFGQWRRHLHNIIQSRAMLEWSVDKGIDLSFPLKINARDGTLISDSAGGAVSVYDFPGWPLLISAAKALTPYGGVVTVGKSDTAQVQDIAFFYHKHVPIDRATPKPAQKDILNAYAEQVLEEPPFEPADLHSPFRESLSLQQTQLGDLNNRRAVSGQITASLVAKLGKLSNSVVPFGTAEERTQLFGSDQQEALKNTVFTVDPASSYFREHNLMPGATVSLHRFMEDQGIELPTNYDQLMGVAKALLSVPAVKPALGDLGGALSWPTLLSNEDQRKLHSVIRHDLKDEQDDHLLAHWTRNVHWEAGTLNDDPHQVLNNILKSTKPRVLGMRARSELGEIASPDSLMEWMLAALQTSLDSESVFTNPPASTRTKVAGFDLANPYLGGKSASALRGALSDHLIRMGKATVRTAPLAVFVLLSRKAPALLVKEIPEEVKFGSHTWVSFSTAVARIEAQAPGSTSKMTFAQVMTRAEQIPLYPEDRLTEQLAQNEALKDWGVVNGILDASDDDIYTDAKMDEVRNAFNEQVAELSAASTAFATQMPKFHEKALKQLQSLMPNLSLDDLQDKCITRDTARYDSPGPYSVLDLYLTDRLKPSDIQWRSSNNKISLPAIRVRLSTETSSLSDLKTEFEREFSAYVDGHEAAISAQTKHLISSLPLADRKMIEYGQLTVGQYFKVYRSATTGNLNSFEQAPGRIFLHSKLDENTCTYEINWYENTITKRDDLNDIKIAPLPPKTRAPIPRGMQLGDSFYLLAPLDPPGNYTDKLLDEKDDARTPRSFFSERTRYIADAKLKIADIPSYKEMAQGMTTFDTEVSTNKKVGEFFLNLVPFYSAVNNFAQGKVGEGIADLALDVFGFFVAFGAAAKGVKALKVGSSAFKYFKHGARIFGRGAIGALNPLDGIGTLANGVATAGKNLVKLAARQVAKWTTPEAYNVIKALKGFDSGAIGTAKIHGELVETVAAQKNGKWYAIDTATRQPYGLPLKDFLPSARINVEEFGRWASAADPGKKISDEIVNKWKGSVTKHRGTAEFDNGYSIGASNKVPGLDKANKIEDIMKLAGDSTLTAEQVGIIARKYDDIAYRFGRSGSARFIDNIEPRFGTVIPLPQVVYLTQTLQLSDGQCAALSRIMATAMEHGKEAEFIKNLYTAAAFPTDPASRAFTQTLRKLQNQVGGQTAFHAGKTPRQLSYKDMIKELSDSPAQKSLMIDSPGHAMTAGVKMKDGEKVFWFYDPNFGLANFSTAEAMEGGLTRLFHDKKLNAQYKTHSLDRNNLEFKVFEHDDAWVQKNSVFGADVKGLYDVPLIPSGLPRSVTNEQLKFNWEKLHANPENQGLICYEASMRVGQAEKTLSPQVYDTVLAATNRKSASNYSAGYLELMDIKPDNLKTTFNPADITESGLINFKYANEGGDFAHTVYIQKTSNNELFLFNTNSPDLDLAMIKSGNPPQISGGMTVYKLSDGNHKGLQDFIDGVGANVSWQYAYTPASKLNANVRKAQS